MSKTQGDIKRLVSAAIMDIASDPRDDRNHTQKNIVEAVNAEKQLWEVIQSKGLLHTDVQELYHKTCCTYEKIILNDHELAELQDIEYSLWMLHYRHINEFRNKIRGSPVLEERLNLSKGQSATTIQQKSDKYLEGFRSFLSDATEFYHQLIKKIRIKYGLAEELLSSNQLELSCSIESSRMRRCLFSCHRCLVCLGDLARYRQLYGTPDGQPRSWSAAATHYLNASLIWPDSGNPHNQLALLATYFGDELLALYHFIRSLAVKEPFPDAWDNLMLLFEKNRSSHLHSLSSVDTFDFLKPSKSSSVQRTAPSSVSFSNCHLKETAGDDLTEETELWSLIVRMLSYFYIKPSSEDFPCLFNSTVRELEDLLLLNDARLKAALESYQRMDATRTGPFRVLQLVSVLIFTIHILCESSKLQKVKDMKYMQQDYLIQQAFTVAFIFMGRIVNRCMMAEILDCSPLLPTILVFVEWLVGMLDRVEQNATDKKCASATNYFFNAFVDLLNEFEDEGCVDSVVNGVLWEDNELQGFSPILQSPAPLVFQTSRATTIEFEDRSSCQTRICRIFDAAMKIVNRSNGVQRWIFHEKRRRKFYTTMSTELSGRSQPVATKTNDNLEVGDFPQHTQMAKDVVPLNEATETWESETDKKRIDVRRNSPVEEEEEVIIFKPLTRHNSAPLHLPVVTSPQIPDGAIGDLSSFSAGCLPRGFSLKLPKNEAFPEATSFCSESTVSSSKKLWEEPIPEDSIVDSFTEADSPRFRVLNSKPEESQFLAGPPSLSSWVVNKGMLQDAGGKELKDLSKQGSEHTCDNVIADSSGHSVTRTDINLQDVKPASSSASHFMYGSTYEGVSVTDHQSSPSSSHIAPPYIPPVPSAPFLPDDATWFNTNFPDQSEDMKAKHGKGFFPVMGQVNSYSDFTGTQGPPNRSLIIPTFSNSYTPYSGLTNSAQWLHQYQMNLDQAHGRFPPIHIHTPGMFQDAPTMAYSDQRLNLLAFNPMKHLDDLAFHPGFSGADEQKWERTFPVYPGPSPYGAVRDLISEQQQLLKNLKEKEWHLQQGTRLGGSA